MGNSSDNVAKGVIGAAGVALGAAALVFGGDTKDLNELRVQQQQIDRTRTQEIRRQTDALNKENQKTKINGK